jgi:hypothetical protein
VRGTIVFIYLFIYLSSQISRFGFENAGQKYEKMVKVNAYQK